jgi:hypothetical protein
MLTTTHKLEFKSGKRTAKTIVEAGTQPEQPTPGRLPRITKMMALAIRLDHFINSCQLTDQTELARADHVSRSRLTQNMDLNLLEPDIQEVILLTGDNSKNQSLLKKCSVRNVARIPSWSVQRRLWKNLK